MENEVTVDFPATIFKKKYGFSLDCGTSLQKVACATDCGNYVRFHFKSFGGNDLGDALDYIKSLCGKHVDPGSTIHVTGIQMNTHKDLMKEKLGVRIRSTFEFMHINGGFHFLSKHLSVSDLVFDKNVEAMEYGKTVSQDFTSAWKAQQEINSAIWTKYLKLGPEATDEQPDRETSTDKDKRIKLEYPVMLVQVGSTTLYMVLNEDKTFEMVPIVNPISGMALWGLSSLLLGTKSFDEFEALAREGCGDRLHAFTDNKMSHATGEAYGNFSAARFLPFMFAKTANKDLSDVKKEDLAAALMSLVAWQLACTSLLACSNYNIRQVFFCGGLTTGSETFRRELTKYMEEMRRSTAKGPMMDFYVLKLGGYAGALSGLLKNLQSE